MTVRPIVHIDEEKCDGCGLCVPSCAEGAIRIVDGKARLVEDSLCDGLGACLGECPRGAISVEDREAVEFDEASVEVHLGKMNEKDHPMGVPSPRIAAPIQAVTPQHQGGCPGSRMLVLGGPPQAATGGQDAPQPVPSALRQWPVQLHLVSPRAPYFAGADLLLAADCTAFAMGDFHSRWLSGKALAVACPKLDHGQEAYLQKLVALMDEARVNTVTVLVMEVPCCGGLVSLVRQAQAMAGRKVPVKQVTVGLGGAILQEEWL